MKVPIIAIGGGGHLRVVLEALRLREMVVEGIVDADPALHGTVRYGLPVLGGDAIILERSPVDVQLVSGIGALPGPNADVRRHLFTGFRARGYRFPLVIHPAAVIGADCSFGEGVQIMAGVVIQPGVTIGEDSIVNTGATIDHDCRIGAHVHVAPGATLSGGITIGDRVHVGAGATIIQGVEIGADAIIAAGAVVVGDVAPGTLVLGVPARERG